MGIEASAFTRFFLQLCLLAGMLGRKVYSRGDMVSFVSKGFPLQRPDWRVIYCSGFILHISNTTHFQLSRYFQF